MLAAMELDHSGLEVLDESECLRLLATAGIGRVGLSVDALPAVFPVHFGLLGRDPVFRTQDTTMLAKTIDGQVVCLEADDLTAGGQGGWSVMVIGVGEVLRGGELVARAACLTLPRWSSVGTDQYVRISADLLSGRRSHAGHP